MEGIYLLSTLFMSIVAIGISLWSNVIVYIIKQIRSDMVWDEARNTFFIIIMNTGKRPLVIKSVSLITKGNKAHNSYFLGKRDNVWADNDSAPYLAPKKAIKIAPSYGSIYDVFAYSGHSFIVDKSNENLQVYIEVRDIDNKKWIFKTQFTLGDVDQNIQFATTFDNNRCTD